MIETRIVNVVATASLDQMLNLNILKKYPEISYIQEQYGGRVAYFKAKKMKGKVSLFLNGKMISVGTTDEIQAVRELKIAMKFLIARDLVKPVELKPKVQNIVVSADFKTMINLENLPEKLKAIYEPEQFPGAIIRLKEPIKTSALIFASGKAVITGLKNSNEIEPTVQLLERLLELNETEA